MRIRVITIFPAIFDAVTNYGITGRAVDNGLLKFETIDLRAYGQGKHRHLDDRPFGGGPGMVMLAEPIIDCVSDLRQQCTAETKMVFMSPQGQPLKHANVCQFAELQQLIVLCGRYEGIDQRALDIIEAEEWSIGDYVLSGGELAAMVLIDAIVRQLPGALGNDQSSQTESFVNGWLDCVHYTRPQTIAGRPVPKVLLSGDHRAIEYWRLKQSLGRTWLRRPDLLESLSLNDNERRALTEFKDEYAQQRKS